MNHGFTDWKKWLDWQVKTTAEVAFRDMSRCPYERLYLYFIPGGTEFGEIASAPQHRTPTKSGAWELADQNPMPSNCTLPSLKAWIRERVGRLPLLA